MLLNNARIVLGVCGGIAAYKAADLCSKLVQAGAEVRVAFSANADQFIAPLTFEALCQHPVYRRIFHQVASYEMEHITWSKWADLLLIAPASADMIARLAGGIADDPITTTYLAYVGRVVIAPAMNTQMWSHPATRENITRLQQRGDIIIDPDAGNLACGDIGVGRLAPIESILSVLNGIDPLPTPMTTTPLESAKPFSSSVQASNDSSLSGKRILITSGPTHEFIDPVRFISNPSSGKMGAALAREAYRRGAEVHLVTGPVESENKPPEVSLHQVTTAEQMMSAVKSLAPDIDVFIFAAAVGDFRVGQYVGRKIKRTGNSITLPLVENPDISQTVGFSKDDGQVTIGFAAETEDLEANALSKIERKNLDAIVANNVSAEGIGFESPENEVTIYFKDGSKEHIAKNSKANIAREIFRNLLSHNVL